MLVVVVVVKMLVLVVVRMVDVTPNKEEGDDVP